MIVHRDVKYVYDIVAYLTSTYLNLLPIQFSPLKSYQKFYQFYFFDRVIFYPFTVLELECIILTPDLSQTMGSLG